MKRTVQLALSFAPSFAMTMGAQAARAQRIVDLRDELVGIARIIEVNYRKIQPRHGMPAVINEFAVHARSVPLFSVASRQLDGEA